LIFDFPFVALINPKNPAWPIQVREVEDPTPEKNAVGMLIPCSGPIMGKSVTDRRVSRRVRFTKENLLTPPISLAAF